MDREKKRGVRKEEEETPVKVFVLEKKRLNAFKRIPCAKPIK